jgi:hypothetical protein
MSSTVLAYSGYALGAMVAMILSVAFQYGFAMQFPIAFLVFPTIMLALV